MSCFSGEGKCFSSWSTKGSATILALLITGVIITVGIGFNWLVKEHLKAAEGLKRKSEAMVKAVSTYNTLMYSILAGSVGQNEVVFANGGDLLGVESIPLNNDGVIVHGDVEIKIQDSNGMISLANPNIPALQNLLRNASPGEDKSPIIIDSYLDWVGIGNVARTNGAKEAYYKAEGKSYSARKYSIQYKEEFALLRGMDPALYKKIAPYLTLLPNSGFNPNTAGEAVLTAYLGLAQDSGLVLKDQISQTPVTSNPMLFKSVQKEITEPGKNFYPSDFWDITIKVGKPEPVYSLKAGIDKRVNTTYPFSVVYWEKG